MKKIHSIRIVDSNLSDRHCTIIVQTVKGWQYTVSWALPKPTEQEVKDLILRQGFKNWIRS